MIWTGKKVYDPITNSWSSGYWIKDEKGALERSKKCIVILKITGQNLMNLSNK